MNISDGRVDARDLNWMHFSASDFERHRLVPGDVIITEGDLASAMNVGRSAVFRGEVPDCCIQNSLLRFRLNGAGEPSFFHFAFEHLRKHGHFAHATMSTTVFHLSAGRLATIPIAVPDEPEQRQIAAILDTIDDAIRKTEQIIAKLKQVKQGLLHDLLTRGIDDNGELRDPERHPEQFKESALGRIPRGWEVTNLDTVSESVTSGSRGWATYYAEAGALFIRIGNLTREHINLRYESVQFVQPPATGEGTRTALVPGDLLISITADLGIIGVVPHGLGEAYVNQHIALVRVRPDAANSRWLGHYLASQTGYRQIRRLDDSGAKAGLNLPTVRRLLAANPPRKEQDELTHRLDGVDSQIEVEGVVQKKLRLLKAGLMEDLLTGRVRVTNLLESAAP